MISANQRRAMKQATNLVRQFAVDGAPLRKIIYGIGDHLGRTIELVPWDFGVVAPGDLTGAWVPTAVQDFLFYPYSAAAWHKDHVCGHELGHLLMHHTPRVEEWPAEMQATYGSQVIGYRGRTGYEDAEEAQAERFASLVRDITNGMASRPDAGEGTEFDRLRGTLE